MAITSCLWGNVLTFVIRVWISFRLHSSISWCDINLTYRGGSRKLVTGWWRSWSKNGFRTYSMQHSFFFPISAEEKRKKSRKRVAHRGEPSEHIRKYSFLESNRLDKQIYTRSIIFWKHSSQSFTVSEKGMLRLKPITQWATRRTLFFICILII